MSESANEYQVAGNHYQRLDIQPWAFMQSFMTREAFNGFLLGNATKYIARAGKKGDAATDIRKATHYLAKWLEVNGAEE
jgi:hypothetical protein